MKLTALLRLGACAFLVVAITQTTIDTADAQRPKASTFELVEEPGVGGKFEELLSKRDLAQFRGYESEEVPDCWSIEGKHLVFDGEGKGDIMTKSTYEDFELQVEWRIEEGGNSGIMFWVNTGDAKPYMSGPELQILDDDKHGDGKSELTSAGALYGLYPATDKSLRKPGTFNKSRIIVEANKLTHYLNGKKVVEAEIGSEDWNKRLAESKFKDWEKFAKVPKGHICFQNHGDPVRFRNIRVKRIPRKADADGERRKLGGATIGIEEEGEGGGDVTRESGRRSNIRNRGREKAQGPQNRGGPGNVPGVGGRGGQRGGPANGGPPITPPPSGKGG